MAGATNFAPAEAAADTTNFWRFRLVDCELHARVLLTKQLFLDGRNGLRKALGVPNAFELPDRLVAVIL